MDISKFLSYLIYCINKKFFKFYTFTLIHCVKCAVSVWMFTELKLETGELGAGWMFAVCGIDTAASFRESRQFSLVRSKNTFDVNNNVE